MYTLAINIREEILSLLPEEWNHTLNLVLSLILHILCIILIFWVIKFVIDYLFGHANFKSRYIKYFRGFNYSPTRTKTIMRLVRNAINYIYYFLFGYTILQALGAPIGTLLASAGIAGVAIGLGAKDLITDVVNGFFIIFEGHYGVGDYILLPDHGVEGTVKNVGIRSTVIQAASGETFYLRNSEVHIVNNKSRNDMRVLIEIPLSNEQNLEKIEPILAQVTRSIQAQYAQDIVGGPDMTGIMRGPDQSFNYRIAFYVKNGQEYYLGAQFYRHYLIQLHKAGVDIPSSVYDDQLDNKIARKEGPVHE